MVKLLAMIVRLWVSLLVFTLLPALVTVVLGWTIHQFAFSWIAHHHWTMPVTVALGAFLGGVLIRVRMEQEAYPFGLFCVGILAQLGFALAVWIDAYGQVLTLSPYLPHGIPQAMVPLAPGLPAIGLFGVLAAKILLFKV